MKAKHDCNLYAEEFEAALTDVESKMTMDDIFEMNKTIFSETLEIVKLIRGKRISILLFNIAFIFLLVSIANISYATIPILILTILSLRKVNRYNCQIKASNWLVSQLKKTKNAVLSRM